MLYCIFSNRVEILAEALKKALWGSSADPLEERLIILPSQAMKRFLMMNLVDDYSVAMGLQFPYLDKAIKALVPLSFPSKNTLSFLIEKEIEKRTKGQNPDIRFRERIQAISRNYIDNEIINYKIKGRKVKFDADTISDILKSVDYIQTVQYKNPIAYILGFFASNGGVEIDEESIQNIFKLVTDKKDKKGKVTKDAIIKDGNVKPADIIRYANLWINIRKLMD